MPVRTDCENTPDLERPAPHRAPWRSTQGSATSAHNTKFLKTGAEAKPLVPKEQHKTTGVPPPGHVDTDKTLSKLPVWQRTSTTLAAKYVFSYRRGDRACSHHGPRQGRCPAPRIAAHGRPRRWKRRATQQSPNWQAWVNPKLTCLPRFLESALTGRYRPPIA